MKKIVILGSTGSIGVTALKVIRQNPEKYKVVGLTAGRNVHLLLEQITEFKPKAVAVLHEKDSMWLKDKLQDQNIEIYSGEEGFVKVATMADSDIVISSIMGAAGLVPTFSAIKAGKDIALANKETMVMAGPIVVEEVKKRGVFIIPVDSEH
ncbi:MAG: 1-deoxy-D-xylulose-5-phosphate reductoisomerase, partial [Deltaproteobacteria bacterium]